MIRSCPRNHPSGETSRPLPMASWICGASGNSFEIGLKCDVLGNLLQQSFSFANGLLLFTPFLHFMFSFLSISPPSFSVYGRRGEQVFRIFFLLGRCLENFRCSRCTSPGWPGVTKAIEIMWWNQGGCYLQLQPNPTPLSPLPLPLPSPSLCCLLSQLPL